MNETLLEPFDRKLVARLARLANESSEARTELLAHAVAAVRESHVCLSPALHARRLRVDETAALTALRSLADSPLVAVGEASDESPRTGAPFVLDAKGRLYLARYFDHQQALATKVTALARAHVAGGEVDANLVETLFPAPSIPGPDRQREAALHAATHAFTIISGGPGTGKTSTVVKLLALLVGRALATDAPPPRVLLLAPTGKASARLAESIAASVEKLAVDARIRAAIPRTSSTLHRALSVLPDGGFRHGPERPLDADVVIVDEASMVDLAMMRALLDAIREGTRLVLLGDRDQLASVEAGSVLADLSIAASAPGSPLAGSMRELVHSHRFGESSGIGALARAIRVGDVEGTLALLRDRAFGDATLGEPIAPRGLLPVALQRAARLGYAGLLATEPHAQLESLTRFRVLAAHRSGPLGVTMLGSRVANSIGRDKGSEALGTPILVLENDADVALFNGDVGAVGRTAEGARTVWFGEPSAPRSVGFGRLPRHEACWAMSIHKSQGSEFDSVAVVIPEGSAIASRELLYTAITRARREVMVHASETAIAECVSRAVVRASGLVDAILARS